MASRQALYVGGGVVAAGTAYYLYTAGGNPKLAEKELEHDAAKLRNRFSRDASSTGHEAQKGLEVSAAKVGSSVDYAIEQVKNEGKYYTGQIQQFGKDIEKKAETIYDQAKAEGKNMQRELQGYEKEAEKKAREAYEMAKAQGQQVAGQLQGYQSEAEKKLADARRETGTKLASAVDSFDKGVDQGAAKAKGGIFSWFGSK